MLRFILYKIRHKMLFLGLFLFQIIYTMLLAQSLATVKHYKIEGIDKVSQKEVISLWKKINSLYELMDTKQAWYQYFYQQGKQEVYLDTAFVQKDTLYATIYEGKIYGLRNIEITHLPAIYEEKIEGIKNKKAIVPLNWNKIERVLQSIVLDYQNKGYPFARFYDLNIAYQQRKDSILTDISYLFDSGKLFKIDSIVMQGKKRENQRLLYAMLRMRPEDIYIQNEINDIPRVLNNSIYYQNVKPALIKYKNDGKATLVIPFQLRKTNQFDALVGILPPLNTENDRRFQFTGMINATLVSMFKQGESVHLKYEKLPLTAQRMELKLQYPYMLGSPLHTSLEGNWYQQSVEFSNIQGKTEAKYQVSPFLSANLYYHYRQTILSDSLIKMVYVHKTRNVLTALSSNSNLYGTGLSFEKLDYKQVPTRGISFDFMTAIGQKVIRKNPAMLKIKPTFYDSIPQRQNLVEADIQLKAYYRIKKRNVLHFANRSHWLNQTLILPSDQVRLGGSKSIRGFNENQFYADKFSMFTLEYRFLLDAKSYLQAFYDYAYLYDSALREKQQANGIGLGMTYNIPLGMLSISYAVGKSNNQSFQFGRGRIHIGITNEF